MGKLFSSMGGLCAAIYCSSLAMVRGASDSYQELPPRAMRHYRLSTKYRGLFGRRGQWHTDDTDAKKKAPEVTPVGFRDINFNTKKEGGHLLSRIALQYHRRSRA